MKWMLFIDDIRNPKTVGNWKVARTGKEAFILIEQFGFPEHISFDHDLGCDAYGQLLPTAYDFVKELGEMILDGKLVIPENFSYNIHSSNPVGRQNIDNYLINLLKHLNNK